MRAMTGKQKKNKSRAFEQYGFAHKIESVRPNMGAGSGDEWGTPGGKKN